MTSWAALPAGLRSSGVPRVCRNTPQPRVLSAPLHPACRSAYRASRRRGEAPAQLASSPSTAFSHLASRAPVVQELLREAALHARSDIPVLITGETGSGKELLARAVHQASPRSDRPLVVVNMLSLPTGLFEAELFGHARGAFTGADRAREGHLARARGGTLLLDEIGDLPLELQGKLLRVLQEREYTPVGQSRPERADVRFIAATNQDLDRLVQQRRFRKDLFYRLQFAHLRLPPLRERLEDLPLLVERILGELPGRGLSLSEEAMALLTSHHWPGNVRELRGLLEAGANLATGGVLGPEHLKLPVRRPRAAAGSAGGADDLKPLAEVERRHILAVYEATGNNKSRAARALGIGLHTLQRKLKAYGVK